MVITRFKNASPEMILTAFDVKFRETKDEIPPRACGPNKKSDKNNVPKVDAQKVRKKTMSTKRVPRPPARPPARAGGPGGGSLPGRGKRKYLDAPIVFKNLKIIYENWPQME